MKVNTITLFLRLASDVDLDPFSVKYCVRRIKSEGIAFLTETLPELSKAVLRSLELGYFERPTCFRWKGKSLLYFRSFLNRIFDQAGVVLTDVDPLAIYQIRQLGEYFYKLSLPFETKDIEIAEAKFVSTDDSLSSLETDRLYVDQLRKDFETYYQPLASASVSDILSDARARPGPGTYSQYKEWTTLNKCPWFLRKDVDYSHKSEYKAYSGLFKPYKYAPNSEVDLSDPDFSEVLFVPKDSRGPRTIVREPYTRLIGQMSFNAFISAKLTRLSKGRINFQNQQVNRELARASSITRENATVDLKDASDRVDANIVRHIFRNSPGCLFFVLNRTKECLLPGSGVLHRLKKLSGMGSGLTFPCMSLLIHLTITRSFVNHLRIPYSRARLLIYVYGDDIVVPCHLYDIAVRALERVKLQVNNSKSYRHSFFRESCGGDFYAGQDVAPVRLKLSGSNLRLEKGLDLIVDGELSVLQLERHCRELVRNGMIGLSEHFYKILEAKVGKLHDVCGASPVLGRYKITTPAYSCDDTGQYETLRVLIPVPKARELDRNPFVFLGRFLRSKTTDFLDYLDCDQGIPYSMVAEPYKIRYSRRRVSAFRLMG